MSASLRARFAAEIAAASLPVAEAEWDALFPVWEENLDRREAMRRMDLPDDLAPAPGTRALAPLARPARARLPRAAGFDDPADLGIGEAAAAMRAGLLSAAELAAACLRRIAAHNGVLQAFLHLDADRALRAARAADRLRRRDGPAASPLLGIPFAVKDHIAVRGLPMTAGSRRFIGHVSAADSDVVARLRRAGAIPLGTTGMHEFGAGPPQTEGPLPTGRNPYDLSRIPGGSSSGSAVAVAARMVPTALGSDSAGSIRIPAAYCGLVGFKPTRGLVPTGGAFPYCWSLDTIGPLARSVRDAALLLDGMAGTGTAALRPGALRGLRIGVLRAGYLDAEDLDPEVRQATTTALAVLRAEGARLRDVVIPELEHGTVVYTTLVAECAALHAGQLRRDPSVYTPWLRTQLYGGALVTGPDLLRARRLQALMTGAALAALREVDLLVLPAQATPATPFGASFRPALTQPRARFTRSWNITGLPALVLPCGVVSSGLPIGLQFVGPPDSDALVLAAGHAYEAASAMTPPRPDPAAWEDRR